MRDGWLHSHLESSGWYNSKMSNIHIRKPSLGNHDVVAMAGVASCILGTINCVSFTCSCSSLCPWTQRGRCLFLVKFTAYLKIILWILQSYSCFYFFQRSKPYCPLRKLSPSRIMLDSSLDKQNLMICKCRE